MTTPYQHEATHERKLLNHYIDDLGFDGTRAAGSHGLVDIIVWNDESLVFIASQSVKWDMRKAELIWRSLHRPPGSVLLFVEPNNTYNGDVLAEQYEWDKNTVSKEVLTFAIKRGWNWVKIVHGPKTL